MPATLRIFATSLLMDACFFCAWAAVPFLVRHDPALWLDDGDLGTLRAASSLVYIAGSFGLSRLWMRWSRAAVARLAALAVGALMIAASVAHSRIVLVVALPLGTFALSAFWPSLMALVGETPGKTLVKRIASFNCWWSIGKAAAFLAAGEMLQAFGDPALTLRVAGGLMLALAALVPGRAAPASSRPLHLDEERGDERSFLAGLCGIYAAWTIAGAFETHLPKGFGPAVFGATFGDSYARDINQLLFALFGGQALGFLALRAWTGWPSRRGSLIAAIFVMAAAQAALRFSSSLAAWIALLIASGAASSLCYAQSLYHAQAGRGDKVRRSGIHEGTLSSGSLTGSLVAGHLMQATGEPRHALSLTACAGVVALAGSLAVMRRRAR